MLTWALARLATETMEKRIEYCILAGLSGLLLCGRVLRRWEAGGGSKQEPR